VPDLPAAGLLGCPGPVAVCETAEGASGVTDPVSLLLHDGHLLLFQWTASGTLSIDLWRPSHVKDGWMLSGSTIFSSEEARAFLQRIAERRPIDAQKSPQNGG
jgi:hypothetical protein